MAAIGGLGVALSLRRGQMFKSIQETLTAQLRLIRFLLGAQGLEGRLHLIFQAGTPTGVEEIGEGQIQWPLAVPAKRPHRLAIVGQLSARVDLANLLLQVPRRKSSISPMFSRFINSIPP